MHVNPSTIAIDLCTGHYGTTLKLGICMEAVRRPWNLKKNQLDDPDPDPAKFSQPVSPSDPDPVWAKFGAG